MAPGLRSSSEDLLSFLKSSEFSDIIENIVKKQTDRLQETIDGLKREISVLKQNNIDLLNMLNRLCDGTVNKEPKKPIEKKELIPQNKKVTFADATKTPMQKQSKTDVNLVEEHEQHTETNREKGIDTAEQKGYIR
ncbi:hypothetical protein QE152_g26170 [Popillia japonica]|uniref:Uncharacterized protein n=1 Tax=Popillia japonica TaxID=7064 RepID=A0AAW1JXY3_POPJA